ncbi:PQQ-dependent sugar dehydrogenase [Comamonas serinivorans]|nr:PQQ-dependent sugar dehydrogenase [Comamonas serinivorans]
MVANEATAQPAVAEPVTPQVVAKGLRHPWAVAFLPEGRFLVTERPGALRVVQADGQVGAPLQGVPTVAAGGQGGLLDVVLDHDFERNRRLYLCYSEPADEPGAKANSTALASARLSADGARLEQVRVIFSQRPKVASTAHFGCRIVQGMQDSRPDGTVFLGLGDRYSERDSAQKLDTHLGKLVRVNLDGSVPKDNPLVGRAGALPEIYSWGHRNIQGAALDGQGRLWAVEHGAQGGDELNRPLPGVNHGWPVITHGVDYNGSKIGEGSAKAGMAQPVWQWTPSIAPSGLVWLTSDRYGKAWQGSAFVGSLKFRHLVRLQMKGDTVAGQQSLLQNLNQRIRDVRQGPDGLLYVLTDAPDGQLIRLLPKP